MANSSKIPGQPIRQSHPNIMIILSLILISAAIYFMLHTAGIGLSGVLPVQVDGISVVTVPNSPIDLSHNNQLVYTHGTPVPDLKLQDPLLGYTDAAIKLIRKIEMYQWTQSQQSKKQQLGHSVDQETVVYTYAPIWSSDLIDSNAFKDKTGYRNPLNMPLDGVKRKVQNAKVGDFQLSAELIEMMDFETQIDLSGFDLTQIQANSKSKVQHDGKYIFVGDNVQSPAIGDIRISLYKVAPTEVSIIAQQTNTTLHPMSMVDGTTAVFLANGHISAKELVQRPGALSPWVYYVLSLLLLVAAAVMMVTALDRGGVLFQAIARGVDSLGLYAYSALLALAVWSLVMMLAFYHIHLLLAGGFLIMMAALVVLLIKFK